MKIGDNEEFDDKLQKVFNEYHYMRDLNSKFINKL